jgi:hypothetical protein
MCSILSTGASVLNSSFDKCRKYPKWNSQGVGESLEVELGVFGKTHVVVDYSSRVGIYKLLDEDPLFHLEAKEENGRQLSSLC